MNHEIKGGLAERVIDALERIADALETFNDNQAAQTRREQATPRSRSGGAW